MLVGVVFVHLWALHHRKSNNPLGIDIKSAKDTIPFHPYYTVKDSFGIGVMMFILLIFTFYMPNALGEVINYEKANPLQTPPHIVPEWYFLPFYAILRAIPDKLGGVVAMVASIVILFILPWLDTSRVRSARLPPDLQVGVLGLRRGLHRARLGRRQLAGRQLHLDRAGHDRLLLRALPPHRAADRQVRAAHAAAGEHSSGGAGRRRRAGGGAGGSGAGGCCGRCACGVRGEAVMWRVLLAGLTIGALTLFGGHAAYAAGDAADVPGQDWQHEGVFGSFDRGSLQRGFQVFEEVCAACHSLQYIAFRNLVEIGFTEDEAKAVAAEYEVEDGPDDEGEMFDRDRPARRLLALALRQRQ